MSSSSQASPHLEPEIESFIEHCQRFLRPGYLEEPIEAQRRLYEGLCQAYDFGRPAGLEVRDFSLPGPAGKIPARLYRRSEPSVQAGLVYMHGGSWYLGGLDSHDSITAEIADRAGVTVVAVDYRLAPEHRFPAAFEDSLAALIWIAAEAAELEIDPARLGVGGDSAGGNLAAALCLAARDRGGPTLRAQLLIYPALARHDVSAEAAGEEEGPLLERDEIRFAFDSYFGATRIPNDPRAAPLTAESFADLPPAAILAAEADPLLPDAETYAARLKEAGVAVALEVARGVVHGFLRARRESPRICSSLHVAVRRGPAPARHINLSEGERSQLTAGLIRRCHYRPPDEDASRDRKNSDSSSDWEEMPSLA